MVLPQKFTSRSSGSQTTQRPSLKTKPAPKKSAGEGSPPPDRPNKAADGKVPKRSLHIAGLLGKNNWLDETNPKKTAEPIYFSSKPSKRTPMLAHYGGPSSACFWKHGVTRPGHRSTRSNRWPTPVKQFCNHCALLSCDIRPVFWHPAVDLSVCLVLSRCFTLFKKNVCFMKESIQSQTSARSG